MHRTGDLGGCLQVHTLEQRGLGLSHLLNEECLLRISEGYLLMGMIMVLIGKL